ncbi:Killer cell lectin-like receptor subfamily B member 1C [Chelonia mydas]|uniref:Killer cell lectin-like receptor subfamily B member 1C n=1 Tax=Chelonia mydas TaxID=8469 RepID=M7CJR4_CHEMY|nr:Killer cell lectin-like receptor subfamily B member 1C [Chelonia mydas]
MEWKSINFMKKLIQIQTDIIFLSKCKQMDIIPKGLKWHLAQIEESAAALAKSHVAFSSGNRGSCTKLQRSQIQSRLLTAALGATAKPQWCCNPGSCKVWSREPSPASPTAQELQELPLWEGSGCKLCPQNWLLHKDKCYWVSKEKHPWNKSRDDCSRRSSRLLVIRDQDEMVTPILDLGASLTLLCCENPNSWAVHA